MSLAMLRPVLIGIAACGVLLFAPGTGCAKTTPQTPEAQRERGDLLYQAYCASCHDIDRGIGPKLTRAVLATRVSAAALFAYTRKNMPYNAGHTLTDDQYWAVTASMLARHGLLPPGTLLTAETADALTLEP